MNNIKIGDKVKIRDDLTSYEYYGDLFCNQSMTKYRGKVFEVSFIDDDGDFHLKGIGNYWNKYMVDKINTDFITF